MKSTTVSYDPFAHGEISLTAPTTESQREIWMSVQMGTEANCAFNESISVHLHGELNIPALQAALQALVHRHESLRMTINADGSLLCINQDQPLSWSSLDLSKLTQVERDFQLSVLCQEAVTIPFDLKYGPLFRVQMIRLSAQTFVLLFTAHHIICDGWSWGVLIPDLAKLYSASCQGTEPNLPEPDRFSDYAIAEASEQDSPDAIATLQYWQDQFKDAIPVLELPTDSPRTDLRTFNSDRIDWELDSQSYSKLKQLASQSGTSFLTLLLASFEVFLHRLTGQPDLVVGLPVAGQALRDQLQLVGHGVHLLPIRSQVLPQETFATYLQKRRTGLLDAYDYPALTFGQLVKQLRLPRDPARIPLIGVTFNLDKGFEPEHIPFEGLAVACQSNPRAFENFELGVNFTEYRYQLQCEWQYNTALFQPQTIHAWIQSYTALLQELVENPEMLVRSQTTPATQEPKISSAPSRTQTTPSQTRSLQDSSRFPKTALEEQLIQVWEKLLDVCPIGIHDSFFTLGGNSILAVQCFAWLEQQIGQKIPLTTLFKNPSIAGLVQTIQDQGWMPSWSSLVPIQPLGSKPPFFCIHPHGGNVLCYRDLARHLEPDQPFYGLQAQGLNGDQAPLESIEEMAALYLKEIRTLQPHSPYFLGGFCVGGFIAYEIAQQLLQSGEAIGLLIAIDTAPNLVTDPEFSEKDISFYWQNLKGRWQTQGVRKGVGSVLKSVGQNLTRSITGTMSPDLEQFDRMWQVHTRAITRYKPQPYSGCLTLVQSEEWQTLYPTFPQQWRQWVNQIQLSSVPGIHDQLLDDPMVIQVAHHITQSLRVAQANSRGGFGRQSLNS